MDDMISVILYAYYDKNGKQILARKTAARAACCKERNDSMKRIVYIIFTLRASAVHHVTQR